MLDAWQQPHNQSAGVALHVQTLHFSILLGSTSPFCYQQRCRKVPHFHPIQAVWAVCHCPCSEAADSATEMIAVHQRHQVERSGGNPWLIGDNACLGNMRSDAPWTADRAAAMVAAIDISLARVRVPVTLQSKMAFFPSLRVGATNSGRFWRLTRARARMRGRAAKPAGIGRISGWRRTRHSNHVAPASTSTAARPCPPHPLSLRWPSSSIVTAFILMLGILEYSFFPQAGQFKRIHSYPT